MHIRGDFLFGGELDTFARAALKSSLQGRRNCQLGKEPPKEKKKSVSRRGEEAEGGDLDGIVVVCVSIRKMFDNCVLGAILYAITYFKTHCIAHFYKVHVWMGFS